MRLSETEWQIMNALWQYHPATAREVSEQLPEDVSWAYTTIKTMLNRLVEKKAVSERKQGKTPINGGTGTIVDQQGRHLLVGVL